MRATRNGGSRSLALLGALLLLYLVVPIGYFLFTLSWRDVPAQLSDPIAIQALITSLLSASLATAIIALLGVPLGYVLARRNCTAHMVPSARLLLMPGWNSIPRSPASCFRKSLWLRRS